MSQGKDEGLQQQRLLIRAHPHDGSEQSCQARKSVLLRHSQGPQGRCYSSPGESDSRSVLSDSLQPHGLQPARLLCAWDSPSKNTGQGSHYLLQEIFLTQGSNPGLLHCRQIFYHLSHQGSPQSWGAAGKEGGCRHHSLIIPKANPDGEDDGTPLQCSCLENPVDGLAW